MIEAVIRFEINNDSLMTIVFLRLGLMTRLSATQAKEELLSNLVERPLATRIYLDRLLIR